MVGSEVGIVTSAGESASSLFEVVVGLVEGVPLMVVGLVGGVPLMVAKVGGTPLVVVKALDRRCVAAVAAASRTSLRRGAQFSRRREEMRSRQTKRCEAVVQG